MNSQSRSNGQYTAADVCIVGAGLAGLMAADHLEAAGLSVHVFEAQSTVGGRVKDAHCEYDGAIELGANWFSSDQPILAEQIERFKIDTFETLDDGKHIFNWDGRTKSFRGTIPPLGIFKLLDIARGLAKFDRIAAQLRNVDAWGNANLAKYDYQSFEQWISANLRTKDGRDFFRSVSEMVFGVEPCLVSLLYVLHYASRSTSLTSLITVKDGHQGMRFTNGPTELCEALAKGLKTSRLVLDAPVLSVTTDNNKVQVNTAVGAGVYKAVLCAASPVASRRITFSPSLPAARSRLLQALPMGRVIKIQAIYDRPYWQEHGFSGQLMSNGYPLTYTIDNSPEDGSSGILAGFVCSSRAEQFLNKENDHAGLVADAIDQMFGLNFPRPLAVHVEDWASNKWIGGSYGAYCPPGVMTKLGQAQQDCDHPIYWAGAEYGRAHPCQMEGALESGQRAARQIIEEISVQ